MQLRRILLGLRRAGSLLRVFLCGGDGGVLHVLVEGGDHLEAAALHLGVAEVHLLQLLLHLGDQETLGTAVAVGDGHLRELGKGLIGGVVLGFGDVAVLQHLGEHVLVAAQESLPVLLPTGRVEAGRVVEDGRERGGLREAELRGGFQEVRLGRSLDPVGTTSEVDGVEVALQDLLLRHLAAHLDGEDQFPELAVRGAFGTQVEDLDVLLGDRRAALHLISLGDVPHSTEHARQREPRVGEEGGVLGRHHGVLHDLRHVGVVEGDAVLHR